MSVPEKDLEKIMKIKKKELHPLISKLKKKHKISTKTLFYMKEYGPHSNIFGTIMKESLKVLIIDSIISSFGGLALENVKDLLISITPLIILLPTLNDMIGNYGTIISSRFSTMLHEGCIKGKCLKNKDLKKLLVQIFIIAIITALISSTLSLTISYFSGFQPSTSMIIKIIGIALINTILLMTLVSLSSITLGLYFYRKGEDPSNLLIPITTSVADLGNMIILTLLILVFF